MVEIALFAVWIAVWIALTVITAWKVGFTENYPGEETPSFPAFIFPLFFGFVWPAALALLIVMAPLTWLAERAKPGADT